MLSIEQAPQKGTIYATFIDKVVYQKYESLDEISSYLTETGLLELHLFDAKKELRFIKTARKGIQSVEISDACEHDDTYEENLFVAADNVDRQDHLQEKVIVVNYIQYDENDMIHIINYRLKEV